MTLYFPNRFFSTTLLLILSLIVNAQQTKPTDYSTMRQRYVNYLTGENQDVNDPFYIIKVNRLDSLVAKELRLLNTDTTGDDRMPKMFQDVLLSSDANGVAVINSVYTRLANMACAYQQPGSKYYKSSLLAKNIVAVMDWFYFKKSAAGLPWYGPQTMPYYYPNPMQNARYANWWFLEFGIPMNVIDICMLIYEQIPTQKLSAYMDVTDSFLPSPSHASGGVAGANGMWAAWIVAARAVLLNNPIPTEEQNKDIRYKKFAGRDKLSVAIEHISRLIDYATPNGFNRDGSYVDHNYIPYTGGYGLSMLNTVIKPCYVFEGSVYSIPESKILVINNWIHHSFEPLIYKTNFMDNVRGREQGREGQTQKAALSFLSSLVFIEDFFKDDNKTELQILIKYYANSFISTMGKDEFYTSIPVQCLPAMSSIMANNQIKPRAELVMHKQFPFMARVSHFRPGFALSVAMYNKTRIKNYEDGGEFGKGWHVSDGATYLYNSDVTQYDDNYWATINAYRIPGTTVNHNYGIPGLGSTEFNGSDWVGGASLDSFGVVGMEFIPAKQTLTAKKSWFMFDKEVVALGSGISANDENVVETVIENRKLNVSGSNQFVVNGKAQDVRLNFRDYSVPSRWAWLQGNVSGADIGYFLHNKSTIHFQRVSNSGRWSDWHSPNPNGIPKRSDLIKRNYLEIWLNHGLNAKNAGYAYTILPGFSTTATKNYSKHPEVEIVENSPSVQCVKKKKLGLWAANFWFDNINTAGNFITVDKKASVIIRVIKGGLSIGISDPTKQNSGEITVTINHPTKNIKTTDKRITVLKTGRQLSFTVNVKDADGRTIYLQSEN